MKFKVFANNQLIGESELESGDPPMGVAFGDLVPNKNYAQHQEVFETQNFDTMSGLNLQVQTEAGLVLEPCSGIGIEDLSKEAGETCIQVNVLGLDSELYDELFANHVAAYEAQFK
ncbi:hypothetical protein ACJJIX_03685 [Microbulbifer sp. VAAC004]|uniref:hypothetical protein n=1 Tax=unclassified Microbulbifer TaxID=2619833 RepID=UPI00403986E8